MRTLVCFACGWFLAMAAAVYLLQTDFLVLAAAGITALASGLILVSKKKTGRNIGSGRLLCGLLGVFAAFCWFFLWKSVWYAQAERAVTAQARVCSFHAVDDAVQTAYGSSVYARLDSTSMPIKTLVYLKDYNPELYAGDTITGMFTVDLSSEAGDYYDSTGTLLIARQAGELAITDGASTFLYFPKILCRFLRQSVDSCFDRDSAGLIKALLTGDRSGMDYAFTSDLKSAGIYHAVAISGLHVSLLATALYHFLGANRRLSAAVTLPILWVFAATTGGAPSVCRAVIMQSILLLAPLLGRDYDPLTGLGLAGILLLLPNPLAVRHIGLQLSVASVAGLMLFSDRLEQYFLNRSLLCLLAKKGAPQKKLVSVFAESAATSLGALLLSTPFMALHFGSVSLISPLTNLLGLWAVTLCFASGACVALLGLLLPALAGLLSWFPSLFVAYLRGLVRMLARIPLSCVYTSANPCLWVWLCFLYAIILLCKKFGPPKSVLRPVCCSIITLCLAVAVPIIASRSAQYDFQMLDVGQGQSILLTSGSTSALIDCGGSDADTAGDLAAQVCQTRGEYALDLLILTHYDDDHAGGTEQLLRRLKIKTICLPDNGAEPQRQAEIQLAAEAAGCQVRTISRDETILFGQGRLRLYAPEKDGNENSCMAVLASFHQTDFFITGDMNQQAEQNLLDRTGLCDAEYLVAGHHGSKYSTGEALLKAIRPGAVLISVGKNSYGHPAEETLGRIRAAGAACYRTDQCGTIRIRG